MKVKSCNCTQCRGVKARKKTSVRKFFKRQMSKWRRRAKEGEVKNFYWA